MKIILIGPAHPLRGGISTFNERLARELQTSGHEIVLYSFSLQYPKVFFPGKSQFSDEAAPADLKIKSVINSVNPANWLRVGRMLRSEQADLIIVRYWLPFMGPSLGTILRFVSKKRTKVVNIIDNVIPHEKRPGDKAFTRYFLKPIDAFLSMSHEVLNDLRSFTNKKAIYSPHPVYDVYGQPLDQTAARKQLNLPPDGRILLFFGLIRNYKGLDLLLAAMADERIRDRKIQLLVAGEFYEDRETLLRSIKDNHLDDSLFLFTEFIPHDDVKIFFSAADCVVQPYRSATQSGISQVAYHFEKPMIVTNVGGLPEIVPDGKVGFVADVDPTSLADAILRFYDCRSSIDFSANIREEKRKYSWRFFADRLLALHEELASARISQ